jgi:Tfp pilus assembly protein PilF
MSSDLTANLEALLAAGNDSPALRLALAARHLEAGAPAAAVTHAAAALAQDERYSAAWKILGRAQAAAGDADAARRSFERGIQIAEERGDRQAAKEMRVFLKRLDAPRS